MKSERKIGVGLRGISDNRKQGRSAPHPHQKQQQQQSQPQQQRRRRNRRTDGPSCRQPGPKAVGEQGVSGVDGRWCSGRKGAVNDGNATADCAAKGWPTVANATSTWYDSLGPCGNESASAAGSTDLAETGNNWLIASTSFCLTLSAISFVSGIVLFLVSWRVFVALSTRKDSDNVASSSGHRQSSSKTFDEKEAFARRTDGARDRLCSPSEIKQTRREGSYSFRRKLLLRLSSPWSKRKEKSSPHLSTASRWSSPNVEDHRRFPAASGGSDDEWLEPGTICSSVTSSARDSINTVLGGGSITGGCSVPSVHRLSSALSGTVYPATPCSHSVPNGSAVSVARKNYDSSFCSAASNLPVRCTLVQQQQQQQQPHTAIQPVLPQANAPYGADVNYIRPTNVRYVTLHRSHTVDSETGCTSCVGDGLELDFVAADRIGTGVDFVTNAQESEFSERGRIVDVGLTSKSSGTQNKALKSLFGVVEGVLGVYAGIFDDSKQRSADQPNSSSKCGVQAKEPERSRWPAVDKNTQKPQQTPTASGINTVKAILGSLSIVSGPLYGARPSASVSVKIPTGMGANSSSSEVEQPSSVVTATPDSVASTHSSLFNNTETEGGSVGGAEAVVCDEMPVNVSIAKAPTAGSTGPRRQSAGNSGFTPSNCEGESGTNGNGSNNGAASRQQTGNQSPTTRDRFSGLADVLGLTGLMRTVTGGNSPAAGGGASGKHSPTGIGSAPMATAAREEQFWVPPTVMVQKKRAHSLQSSQQLLVAGGINQQIVTHQGTDGKNGYGDTSSSTDSIKDLSSTSSFPPSLPPDSQPSLQQPTGGGGGARGSIVAANCNIQQQSGLSGGGGCVNSPSSHAAALCQQRRRRASMQDALDYTKINTSLYDTTSASTSMSGSSGGRGGGLQHARHSQNYDFASIQEENIGSVNFSLSYDPDQALLHVRLIQARDLPPREFSGTADPFCRLRILSASSGTDYRRHGNTVTSSTGSQLQSRVHRRTVCPEFEESFVFDVAQCDLSNRTLEILVCDYDQFSKDECIGQVLYPLDQLALTLSTSSPTENQSSLAGEPRTSGCTNNSDAIIVWKGLTAYDKKSEEESFGDLMFSLSYLSSAERLTVAVIKARKLRTSDDTKASINPYVRVTVVLPAPPATNVGISAAAAVVGIKSSATSRRKRKKTTTKRQTSNPVWNEALVFGVERSLLADTRVELTVLDDGRQPLGADDPLGEVVVGLHGTSGDELAHWADVIGQKPVSARWHRLQPPVSGSSSAAA